MYKYTVALHFFLFFEELSISLPSRYESACRQSFLKTQYIPTVLVIWKALFKIG